MDALVAVGARRPLVAAGGQVAGYEFRLGEALLQRLARRIDQQGQAAYLAALLASARLMAQTGRVGFARVPIHWVAHVVDAQAVAGMWLALEPMASAASVDASMPAVRDGVVQLRRQGAKVGWGVTTSVGLVPDFLLLRQGPDPMAAMLAAARTWPATLQGLPTLATDIANVDDLELALDGGISLVCGALAPAHAVGASTQELPVRPEVRRVAGLLNQLVAGADTAKIVAEIKGDVGLSYELLRRTSSASLAHLNAGSSIELAVVMLGRDELYRWLSVMLLQFGGPRKAASALHEVALWRSRLFELLAIEAREPAPGQLFTLGLSSMLGQILGIAVADVVTTLGLGSAAAQALQEQSGPWIGYMQLAQALEANQLESCGSLADPFGGVARVASLSDEAWGWAATHAQSQGRAS